MDWIERSFGFVPDGGSGLAEIGAGCVVAGLVFALARWRGGALQRKPTLIVG